MNERIFDLAKQAGMRFGLSPAEQKFAELLIKECILIARKAENEDEVYSWYAISNHFGVE